LPDDVHVVNMPFDEVRRRAQELFPFKIMLGDANKRCEYKPAYGLIFADILEGYDYWGHCDLDMIWGRLGHFVTENVLASHDRIYSRGHLTLYRNNADTNRLFMHGPRGHLDACTWQDAFTTFYTGSISPTWTGGFSISCSCRRTGIYPRFSSGWTEGCSGCARRSRWSRGICLHTPAEKKHEGGSTGAGPWLPDRAQ
jgi:hypothetical protein